MEEFQARLDSCFAARTYGDLDPLVADLPGPSAYDDLPVPASQTRGAHPALPYSPDRSEVTPWRAALGSYVTANIVCWLIFLVGGANGFPWPVWVTGPWGAVMLGRAISGYWDDGAHRDARRRRR
jgi:hypothetical protein